MPYKILVAAQNLPTRQKGYISDIRPIETEWGAKETLPNFVRVEVTDGVTWQQAMVWQEQWVIRYRFSVLDDQPGYTDYRVEVDPEVISASDKGRAEIKAEMKDYIDNATLGSIWFGCQTGNYTSNSMDVRVPKPHSRIMLKADFDDKFQSTLEIDRYYFSENGVNWAINKGGEVQITQVKALNYIVDKLSE